MIQIFLATDNQHQWDPTNSNKSIKKWKIYKIINALTTVNPSDKHSRGNGAKEKKKIAKKIKNKKGKQDKQSLQRFMIPSRSPKCWRQWGGHGPWGHRRGLWRWSWPLPWAPWGLSSEGPGRASERNTAPASRPPPPQGRFRLLYQRRLRRRVTACCPRPSLPSLPNRSPICLWPTQQGPVRNFSDDGLVER